MSVPSGRAATISRLPCSRSAWSMSRMMRSGKSCIAPNDIGASPSRGAHHGAILSGVKPLEGKLEPWRERKRALHLLHFGRGGRVRLGLGVVECRRDQVFQHRLFGWHEQTLVKLNSNDPPLGRGADLDQTAAGHPFDLDLIEIVLRLLQLGLGVLRHLQDFIEVGHLGHDYWPLVPSKLSSWASGKASSTACTLASASTSARTRSSAIFSWSSRLGSPASSERDTC